MYCARRNYMYLTTCIRAVLSEVLLWKKFTNQTPVASPGHLYLRIIMNHAQAVNESRAMATLQRHPLQASRPGSGVEDGAMDRFRSGAEPGRAGDCMWRPADEPHDAANACSVNVLPLHRPPQQCRAASSRLAWKS